MDPVGPVQRSPHRDLVAMCYVVVTVGERPSAPGDVRVRFEFRPDLADGRSETRTVAGVDAACETMRAWLGEISSQR